MDIPRFKQIFDTLDEEGQKNVISQLSDEELDAVQNYKPESRQRGEYEKYKETHPTGPYLESALNPFNEQATLKDYFSGRVEALRQLGDPGLWRAIGHDINPANWPESESERYSKESGLTQHEALRELSAKMIPDGKDRQSESIANMALSFMPITGMSGAFRQALRPALKASNPAQTAALQAADAAGFVVPKTYLKQSPIGRAFTNIGDRFAGKEGTKQVAQAQNQPVTNVKAVTALSKTPQGQTLGITKNTPLSAELFDDIAKEANKAYESVRQIGTVPTTKSYTDALDNISSTYTSAGKSFPEAAKNEVQQLVDSLKVKNFDSSAAIDMIKILRENAKKAFRNGDGGLGLANRRAADAIEKTIGEHLSRIKAPKDLISNYQSARKTLAMARSLEDAFNPSTGNVAAQAMGQMQKKGVPLTGELKEIADFSRGFRDIAKEPIGAPPSGGMLEPLAYAAFGKIADPSGAGLLAAGLPLIGKPIARRFMVTHPSTRPFRNTNFGVTQRAFFGAGLQMRNEDR